MHDLFVQADARHGRIRNRSGKAFEQWSRSLSLEERLNGQIDVDQSNARFEHRAGQCMGLSHEVTRRLHLFGIEGRPLILHDEPVRENGKVVGLTTSGARGARTRKALALGMIAVQAGEEPSETAKRIFEIEVAGRLYPARVLARPPFDPAGERMRG